MGIGKTLSSILEENNCNPNELSERTGISPSTIYSIIKRDNMKVDISVLARICKELGVEMNRFYDEYFNEIENSTVNSDSMILSFDEKTLIQKYRTLDDHGKKAIYNTLDFEYGRCSGNDNSKTHMVYKIARSNNGKQAGFEEVSQEEFDRLENAPETDEDFS